MFESITPVTLLRAYYRAACSKPHHTTPHHTTPPYHHLTKDILPICIFLIEGNKAKTIASCGAQGCAQGVHVHGTAASTTLAGYTVYIRLPLTLQLPLALPLALPLVLPLPLPGQGIEGQVQQRGRWRQPLQKFLSLYPLSLIHI